jgi:hypothetical protein
MQAHGKYTLRRLLGALPGGCASCFWSGQAELQAASGTTQGNSYVLMQTKSMT